MAWLMTGILRCYAGGGEWTGRFTYEKGNWRMVYRQVRYKISQENLFILHLVGAN